MGKPNQNSNIDCEKASTIIRSSLAILGSECVAGSLEISWHFRRFHYAQSPWGRPKGVPLFPRVDTLSECVAGDAPYGAATPYLKTMIGEKMVLAFIENDPVSRS